MDMDQGKRRPVDTTRHHRENGWDYRGRAIYHFTLPVEGRYPLFGILVGESAEKAFVRLNPFGRQVCRMLGGLAQFYERKGYALKVLTQMVMPDHVHLVLQVLEPLPHSIGAVVRGFKSACTKVYKQEYFCSGENAAKVQGEGRTKDGNAAEERREGNFPEDENAAKVQGEGRTKDGNAAEGRREGNFPEDENAAKVQGEGRTKDGNAAEGRREGNFPEDENAAKVQGEGRTKGENAAGAHGEDVKVPVHFARIFAGRGSIWQQDPAFYHERILHAPGQLRRMIDYVKDNPRRLWLKTRNPDLFRLHRHTEVAGLTFTSMGNHFLLEWPDRQAVEMSRSATAGQVEERLRTAMAAAHDGAVTYTAAISKGEQLIARALREQGYPMVVLLADGFPKEGTPHERYYKPGGVYFEACSKGQLLLLEPTEQAFLDAGIQSAVEETLRRKAEARRLFYSPVPASSQRYCFVALNEMANRLSVA